MEKHVCPYGLKSRYLLKSEGYEVDDHWLTSRVATDAFKRREQVASTPQAYIGDRHIGGYDDLRRHFGKSVREPGQTSYRPVITIFALSALIAIAANWNVEQTLWSVRGVEWFVGLAVTLLACQKLVDVEGFSTMFLSYSLLGRRWVPYAYLYPFGEAVAGLMMISHGPALIGAPIAALIGVEGSISVFYAVYVQRRELKCACVGGQSSVPLGFVSLTENLTMVAMAIWMIAGNSA